MAVTIALWSLLLEPGKKNKITALGDIRITNAALGEELQDENGRTVVKLTYTKPVKQSDSDDEEEEDTSRIAEVESTVLCALWPGKLEQANLDLVIEEEEEYEFEVIGKNPVYLTGNYIDQTPLPPYGDEEEDEDDEIESDYDLRDVSSDVEIDPSELDIPEGGSEDEDEEEEPAQKPVSKKRRASDAMEVEEKASKKEEKPSKKAKKEEPKQNGETKKDKKEEKKDKKDKKEGEAQKKELPGGLIVKDVKEGTGRAAKKGDTVSMRYIGKFTDGKVFDSNTKGKPFTFRVGAGEVIKGWDEGIVGMKSGGERLLIVPPKLGYGNRKSDGIPPNSTLKFEVKLLEIK